MHWGCGGVPTHAPTHVISCYNTCRLYTIKIHVNMILGRNYRGAAGKKKNIGRNIFKGVSYMKI
jgi:hypothetical protein